MNKNLDHFIKDRDKVEKWLNKYNIKNYELVADENYGYVVNVQGGVNLARKRLKAIPVKFNEIHGNFLCNSNQLTSLDFAPVIVHGDFNCFCNRITSLEGCPQQVGRDFFCHQNLLTSLKHVPRIIHGDFSCCFNCLESLEFCPEEIHGSFNAGKNNLSSLDLLPRIVKMKIYVTTNPVLNKVQAAHDFPEIGTLEQFEMQRLFFNASRQKQMLESHLEINPPSPRRPKM